MKFVNLYPIHKLQILKEEYKKKAIEYKACKKEYEQALVKLYDDSEHMTPGQKIGLLNVSMSKTLNRLDELQSINDQIRIATSEFLN